MPRVSSTLSRLQPFTCLVGALALCASATASLAQNPPPDHPAVTVRGQTYTPRSILARNMGSEADRVTQFTPHKIIGNIYYVGTVTLSSFLVATPEGHILINTTYERNARTIEKSVTDLGFKFSDVKIILGNHAHGDHQEGDALVKQMTGAQVMAMAEDVPALRDMKPGGKEHPIDKILHDGDTVTWGGTTLVAHLTAGHTRGCTTWTTTVREGGRSYNVMIGCSLRSPAVIPPALVEEFNRTYKKVRELPCDVQLGDHGAQYNMHEKFAKLKEGAPNPFVDPESCTLEADVQEAMFHATLAEQQQAPRP
jgi:metallo-beta-lactamase class B